MDNILSENLFFLTQDVFLNMTIFLPTKAICTLRTVCKSLNSWLSDPNNFSWKKRIQAAFPNSFDKVLLEKIEQQFRRLAKFDSLIEAGHQVSFFPSDLKPGRVPLRLQLPWRRNMFVLSTTKHVVLFNATTGSIVAQLDLTERPEEILFDIKDSKVGFRYSRNGLKIYRVEENTFVHERDFASVLLDTCKTLPQMYENNIIFRRNNGNSIEYILYSISRNELVACNEFPAIESFEEISLLEPVLYSCCQDENDQYTVYQIDCNSFEAIELYDGKVQVCVDDEGQGVQLLELIEDAHNKFLQIYQSGMDSSAVEIYDILKRKRIFNQSYSDETKNLPTKSEYYYSAAWKNLKLNIGTHYYATTSGMNGVVTIGDINEPYNDYIAAGNVANTDDFEEDNMPDTPSYFSEYYKEVEGPGLWLSNDILTFKVGSIPHWGRKREVEPRLMFFSMAKREVFGCLKADIHQIFTMGNVAIAFTEWNDVYVIEFDVSYLERNTKKRKLSDSGTDRKKRRKAIILSQ